MLEKENNSSMVESSPSNKCMLAAVVIAR